MSGHSKWSTIKRQKGAADARRSKIFGKLARQISITARDGADPAGNFKLRLAIDRARSANLPNDNIERAIASGSGAGGESTKEMVYEGFGPGGVAVLVQALTDNPSRTMADIRTIFSKHGGSLGSVNSVGWMFKSRGVIRVPFSGSADRRQEIELSMIDAGAEEVADEGDFLSIQTAPEKLTVVRERLAAEKIEPAEADIELIPATTVIVDDDARDKLQQLLAALDEHDDVTAIYSNET